LSLGLLRIETRRSGGLLFLPVMLALAWLAGRTGRLEGGEGALRLWASSSTLVAHSEQIIGPVLAGVAAWAAGRERRRRIDDLLLTTPWSATARRLTQWLGIAVWGVAAYAVLVAYVFGGTWRQATWGGPDVGLILVGLLAVVAHGAVGYAIGYHVPSRFVPPLVAVGAFYLEAYTLSQSGWIHFLMPISVESSVWFGVEPRIGREQALFLSGLTGLALGGVAFRGRRSILSGGVLALSTLLIGAAVTSLSHAADRFSQSEYGDESSEVIPYTPVCSGDPLPVCVHPAYRSLLAETSAQVNRVAAPLVGVPGALERVEQGWPGAPSTDAVMRLSLGASPDEFEWFAPWMASYLAGTEVVEEYRAQAGESVRATEAQHALQVWLLRRAGAHVTCNGLGVTGRYPYVDFNRAACEAADRFEELDPAARRTWLERHYAALRAGKLRLEDMP
jgi:ABC-type transport system involved in multi-copper enzyme maturation permease subunit